MAGLTPSGLAPEASPATRVIHASLSFVEAFMKNRAKLAVLVAILALGGCATAPGPENPAPLPKPFILEEALAGRTSGHGVITPIVGGETEFDVSINGAWDGKTLTLIEDFQYPAGNQERKTWRLTKTASGDYFGTREDVVGQAHGFYDGSAFRLDYEMLIDTPLGKMTSRFRDILYWENDKAIRNNAIVSKIGLRLARLRLQLAHDG